MPPLPRFLRMTGFCFTLTLAACKSKGPAPQGEAPPPVATTGHRVCEQVDSNATALEGKVPARVGRFCLDPNDTPRVYGEGQGRPLEDICTQLFNGECELYRSFGLAQVANLRFVAETGGSDTTVLTLSRFNGPEGAFSFFSQRLHAGVDPLALSVTPMGADGDAALGAGIAYLWRGPFVAELAFSSDALTPEQLKGAADTALPMFVAALDGSLGKRVEPALLRLLPSEELLPLGRKLHFRDALGVADTGMAAQGYYQQAGGKRYSVLVSEAEFEESASDIERTFRRAPGAHKLKDMPFGAFEFKQSQAEGALGLGAVWLFGRRGRRLAAVGDDLFALAGDKSEGKRESLTLSRAEKLRLLRRVLARSTGAPAVE